MIDKAFQNSESRLSNSASDEGSEFGLMQLFRRHWKLLASTIVLGIAGSAAYYLLTPPIYESTSQLLLLPKDASLAARGVEAGQDQNNTTLSQDMLATHMMLVQSPRIVKTALTKGKLEQLPSVIEAAKKQSEIFVDEISSITQYVIDNLAVSRGGKGQSKSAQVLKVAFRHDNADDARQIVSAVVQEFETFLNEKFRDVNTEAADIIERARENLEGSLNAAESKLRSFKEANPILFSGDESTNGYRLQYEQYQSALTELRLERSQQASRLALVETRLKEIDDRKGSDMERLALIDENNAERVGIFLQVFAGDAQSAQFQSQQPARLEVARSEFETLSKLRAQEVALQSNFGSDHPELKMVREQIATFDKFLDSKRGGLAFSKKENIIDPRDLVDSYVSILRHDIEASKERETQLQSQSDAAEEKAKSLVKYELEGEALRLDVTRQRQLYEATIDRLTEIGMARDYAGVINEVIQEAQPGKEIWPKLSICLVIGSLAGLILGCAGAGFSEWRNRELRSRTEIERIADTRILSQIPHVSPNRNAIAQSRSQGSKISPQVHAFHSPQSAAAEIFRGLRTTLFFRAKESDAKTFAITSPLSGDGKSTVASNLSVCIAQAGRKVLLVDCDLRRPSIAKVFGLTHPLGLTDLLAGRESRDKVIVQSEVPNLSILTQGSLPSNPAEVLDSEAFKAFIEAVSNDYEFVFLDCPPVLAVSDPCIVSSLCNAVLVVVQLNARSRPQVQKMMELLRVVHANIFGIVLNSSILEEDRMRGGDEKYGIGYGYGTHSAKTKSYIHVSAPSNGMAVSKES